MSSDDVVRQVRRLRLRARRSVDALAGGGSRSLFKGAGLTFHEVREYQPGDDVRAIDWNVTARAGHPFVKTYLEERELPVFLLLDASPSLDFGTTGGLTKHETAAEVAALVAGAADRENEPVGILRVNGGVEEYVPPGKGARHAVRVLRAAARPVRPVRPGGRGDGSLKAGLEHTLRFLRRRSLLVVISDFLDTGYEPALRRAARRHDLISVRVTDPREDELPLVGLFEVEDRETGERRVIDARDPRVRAEFAAAGVARAETFRRLVLDVGAELIPVSTAGGHLDAVVRAFRARETALPRR